MWQKIRGYLDEKLIRPFRESHAPVHQLALGSSVGMFWAMTPLVGIQMYLVTMCWLLFRLFKQRMNLAVGLAMVWISNPITMGPMYYAFYKVGYITFDSLGLNPMVITFANFKAVLDEALSKNLIDGLMVWGEFLLNDLGWPTMVGGLLLATPSAIATYPLIKRLVNRHRFRLAVKEGLTLEEWEEKHVHSFREVMDMEKAQHKQEELEQKHMMDAAMHPEDYFEPDSRRKGSGEEDRSPGKNAGTKASQSQGNRGKSTKGTSHKSSSESLRKKKPDSPAGRKPTRKKASA